MAKKGDIAGGAHNAGYVKISIESKLYLAHRLAWMYVYGEQPLYIDHINGVRNDNRIINLRSVEHRENAKNQKMRTDNTSGAVGVTWEKCSKTWKAQIKVDGKAILLGNFKSFNDACRSRHKAEIKHGFSIRHGSEF